MFLSSHSTPMFAAVLTAIGCASPTLVEVTVTARDGLPAIDSLAVKARAGGDTATAGFDLRGRGFPLTFTITPENRDGEIVVEVRGLDSLGTAVALGRSTTTIASDTAISMTTQLEPADFLINSVYAGAQRAAFRPGRNGRAIASTGDGFVTAFVNDCIVGSACDVFVRRFDDLGAPQDFAGSTAEVAVNIADEPRVSVPAVAVNDGGEVGIVWETDDAIRYSRVDQGGVLATQDLKITADTVENPTDPAISGLQNSFVLSWFQETDSPVPAGIQRTTVTGAAIGALTTIGADRDARAPSVVGEPAALAAAWSQGNSLIADVAPLAAPGTPIPVATFTGEFVGAPQIAVLSEGYVIAYGRQSANASEGLMLTRLDSAGGHVRDVVVVETSSRATDRPSIAVDDENRIAVVWTACAEAGEPDGNGCGILMRLYDADLSPLTQPAVINTTVEDDQFDPAIATTAFGWAVVWTDNSGVEPDTSIGLRGRVVFIETLL